MAVKTKAEKEAFKFGLFTGLKRKGSKPKLKAIKVKPKATKAMPVKLSLVEKHNKKILKGDHKYEMAYRFASHMGCKFGLSSDEVLKNA